MIPDHDLALAVSRFDLKFVDRLAASHICDGMHLLSVRTTAGQTVRFLFDAPQVEHLRNALERSLLVGIEENDLG